MPTYEYQCTECGEVFDVFQSIKAAPLRRAFCESCGEKRSVKRLIGSGGAVIFKGSGFYETDYRSEGYNKAAKAEKQRKDGGAAASGDTSKAGKADAASSDKAGSAEKSAPAPDGSKKSSSSGQN